MFDLKGKTALVTGSTQGIGLEIARLLATGETAKLRGFISKNGKSFDAKLSLDGGKTVFKF